MTKEKTIREWLEALPDGYRERALENFDPNYNDGHPIDNLALAISEAFFWGGTTEKGAFWNAVADWAFGEGELPPLPEEER